MIFEDIYIGKTDEGIIEVSTPMGIYMRDVNSVWHKDSVSDKEEHEFNYDIPGQEARQIVQDLLDSGLDIADPDKTLLEFLLKEC